MKVITIHVNEEGGKIGRVRRRNYRVVGARGQKQWSASPSELLGGGAHEARK